MAAAAQAEADAGVWEAKKRLESACSTAIRSLVNMHLRGKVTCRCCFPLRQTTPPMACGASLTAEPFSTCTHSSTLPTLLMLYLYYGTLVTLSPQPPSSFYSYDAYLKEDFQNPKVQPTLGRPWRPAAAQDAHITPTPARDPAITLITPICSQRACSRDSQTMRPYP